MVLVSNYTNKHIPNPKQLQKDKIAKTITPKRENSLINT